MPAAPFSACFVRHDRCAVFVHMRTPVLYQGMVKNVRKWCGSEFLASLSRWDVLSVQDLVANESMDTEGTVFDGSSPCSWAVQILQDRAPELAELANHLERRIARSGDGAWAVTS